jgi:hypothetical protein
MAKHPVRLPVIQNAPSDPENVPPRSAGQWVMVGAALILTLWMPLLVVALWVAQRAVAWSAQRATQAAGARALAPQLDAWWMALAGAGPLAMSFIVSCVAGGALIGRFGSAARRPHATLAGASAAALAWAVALVTGNLSEPTVAFASAATLVALGSLFSRLGFVWSRRR